MKRKAWVGGLVVLAVVGGLAAAVAWRLSGTSGKSAGGKPPEPVLVFQAAEVVQPTWARMAERIVFSGPLVAPQTAVVRARVSGTLVSLEVAEGSRVRAGQRLGRIAVVDGDGRTAERAAHLASARAQLVQAERQHASNEDLARQRFISPVALEQSRSALDSARAGVQAAAAALQTLEANLRDATVVAPIAGIVSRRQALPGEKISLEQPLLTLVDLAQLELAGRVGTHEVARLAEGQAVQVQVEGLDAALEGRIARIAPAAEAGSRSIGVIVALDNPQERLRAGQYALAQVVRDDGRDRLTLPLAAVQRGVGQDAVWLVEQGMLARRAVTLGREDPQAGRVEVLHGVDPDSVVLAARFDKLREGAQARVEPQ